MAQDFTTTGLLADIKRKCFIPIAQTTFSDTDLLAMADEELQIGIVPLIMSVREEFFVTWKEYNVTGLTSSFSIPPRAIGSKLSKVTMIVDPTASDVPNEVLLPQLNADQAVFNTVFNNYLAIPAFYLQNNQLFLSPGGQQYAGQTLRQYYFRRPNQLILTSGCSTITSITDNIATVNLIPSTFGTGSLYTITSDVVKANPGFDLLGMDLSLTVNTVDNTITFTDDLADLDIQVGDYICLAGETPVPQIPVEVHTLLAQRTAVKVLEALGDEKNFAIASKKLVDMEHRITGLLSNRVEGAARKVVNNYSTLSTNPFGRF
jgi:hypothetical protein